MNPEKNKFEPLFNIDDTELRSKDGLTIPGIPDVFFQRTLVRPNGEPVPKHWSVFQVEENYVINNYTFKCKYIGETSILFEPVGPIEIGKK